MQDRLTRDTFAARVEHHPSLPSTNDRARQCAAESSGPLPLLIIADRQTAGRGRRANRWWTGSGGLACSLLIEAAQFGLQQSRSPLVALGAAVAVVDTVQPLLGSRSVGIHWPNDVLVDGRKLAGVLVEVPSKRHYVVGIGINTNNRMSDAPPDLRRTATTLLDLTGARQDHTEVLSTLLGHLRDELCLLKSSWERVSQRANAICLQHGSQLTVQTGKQTTTGTCLGIGPSGQLVLDTAQGREEFFSGVLIHGFRV
jgi:BirA family biotin operon repressor/biotin-[acetyl-CoA-carboxylase] ligase